MSRLQASRFREPARSQPDLAEGALAGVAAGQCRDPDSKKPSPCATMDDVRPTISGAPPPLFLGLLLLGRWALGGALLAEVWHSRGVFLATACQGRTLSCRLPDNQTGRLSAYEGAITWQISECKSRTTS